MTSKVECNRLKGILVEKKITQERLAKLAGISENSLTRKINGHRDFWYWEVALITKLLGFQNINEVFPELYDACNASMADIKGGEARSREGHKLVS